MVIQPQSVHDHTSIFVGAPVNPEDRRLKLGSRSSSSWIYSKMTLSMFLRRRHELAKRISIRVE